MGATKPLLLSSDKKGDMTLCISDTHYLTQQDMDMLTRLLILLLAYANYALQATIANTGLMLLKESITGECIADFRFSRIYLKKRVCL